MRILISNDDGVEAEGLAALAKAFKSWGTVVVVAPEKEQSTTGHSLTLHKPLRLKKLSNGFYCVNGGPADCIYLAVHELFGGKKPDLILSGINRGANLGQDVFYSGTVSAAREGAVMGVPAVAVSLSLDKEWRKAHASGNAKYQTNFTTAGSACKVAVAKALCAFSGKSGKAGITQGLKAWPAQMLLNVNVPNLPFAKLKGYRVVHQGFRYYSGGIVKRVDARGRPYYWIGGYYKGFKKMEGTDCLAVDQGFVSLTPLELDTTDREGYTRLQHLK